MAEKKAESKKSPSRAGAKKGAAGSNGTVGAAGTADSGLVGAQRGGLVHHGILRSTVSHAAFP